MLAQISRLPKRQRAVLVLRYYEDRSDAEIAELLGCTPGSVRAYASRALAKLRIDMRPGHPEVPAAATQLQGEN
jgi:RNA polymerase sigma factor (sigma-70 family)